MPTNRTVTETLNAFSYRQFHKPLVGLHYNNSYPIVLYARHRDNLYHSYDGHRYDPVGDLTHDYCIRAQHATISATVMLSYIHFLKTRKFKRCEHFIKQV